MESRDEIKMEVCRAFANGHSAEEIAEVMDMTGGEVHAIIQESNELIEMYKKGDENNG